MPAAAPAAAEATDTRCHSAESADLQYLGQAGQLK